MKYYMHTDFNERGSYIRIDPYNDQEHEYKERTLNGRIEQYFYNHWRRGNWWIFDTIGEAIKFLRGYGKPVLLPDGTTVIPAHINYPELYKASRPLRRGDVGYLFNLFREEF